VSVFVSLYLVQEVNYLLFHGLVEIFSSIIIAGGVFLVAWNSRKRLESDFLLVIGVAYWFVAFLDVLHVFSYAGMGVFDGQGANIGTQFWVAARYLEAVSIMGATACLGSRTLDGVVSFRGRYRDTVILIAIYVVVTAGLVGAIFGGVFPAASVEGIGLTQFKIISEYVIIGLLAVSLGLLYRNRRSFESHVFRLLGVALVLTMAAEFAFTQYVSVYGLSNMVGHFFKLASFYLIYLSTATEYPRMNGRTCSMRDTQPLNKELDSDSILSSKLSTPMGGTFVFREF
jgi:hypothetical protein